jgi:hypothetical protein
LALRPSACLAANLPLEPSTLAALQTRAERSFFPPKDEKERAPPAPPSTTSNQSNWGCVWCWRVHIQSITFHSSANHPWRVMAASHWPPRCAENENAHCKFAPCDAFVLGRKFDTLCKVPRRPGHFAKGQEDHPNICFHGERSLSSPCIVTNSQPHVPVALSQ